MVFGLVQGKVIRGHLSQTIDKDLGVFKENMRKKLKVGIRAVDAAMSFKKAGSMRGSAMAAAASAGQSADNPHANLSAAVAKITSERQDDTDADAVAVSSIKIEGTEEAL